MAGLREGYARGAGQEPPIPHGAWRRADRGLGRCRGNEARQRADRAARAGLSRPPPRLHQPAQVGRADRDRPRRTAYTANCSHADSAPPLASASPKFKTSAAVGGGLKISEILVRRATGADRGRTAVASAAEELPDRGSDFRGPAARATFDDAHDQGRDEAPCRRGATEHDAQG